jgi:nucleoside 2-deoxyribosyltransferase
MAAAQSHLQQSNLPFKPRANMAIVLISILIGLVLKGTLDHFLKDHDTDKGGLQQFLGTYTPFLWFQLAVFIITFLRFVFGAYRYHERERELPTFRGIALDAAGAFILFLFLYLTGFAVKNTILFYELFIAFHVIDLVWFTVAIHVGAMPSQARSTCTSWLVLDAISIAFLLALFLAGFYDESHVRMLSWVAGAAFIALAFVDFLWNWKFYFDATRADSGPLATGGQTDVGNTLTKIYFAGPLFTQAEWQWNAALAAALRARGYEILLPQERARAMISGDEPFAADTLFRANVDGIMQADCVVAILDGADADSGTSWEVGYAHAIRRRVIGIRTDIRHGGDDPGASVNLMLSSSCSPLIAVPKHKRDDVGWVADQVVAAVNLAIR